MNSIDDRRTGARLAGMALVLFLSLSTAAFGAPVGFTVSFGNLFTVDVETGVTELIGPTGLDTVPALALAPNGLLFGVSRVDDEHQLVVIDQGNGNATAIGPLGVSDAPTGLAADFRTRLWMTTANALYLVDSGSGAATLWKELDRQVTSLVARWKQIFFFTDDTEQGRWLEILDLKTGDMKPVWDLTGLQVSILGSSFDADGALWFLGQGGGTLQVVPLGFFKMPDLGTGEIEAGFFEAYHFGDPEAGMESLALAPAAESIQLRLGRR